MIDPDYSYNNYDAFTNPYLGSNAGGSQLPESSMEAWPVEDGWVELADSANIETLEQLFGADVRYLYATTLVREPTTDEMISTLLRLNAGQDLVSLRYEIEATPEWRHFTMQNWTESLTAAAQSHGRNVPLSTVQWYVAQVFYGSMDWMEAYSWVTTGTYLQPYLEPDEGDGDPFDSNYVDWGDDVAYNMVVTEDAVQEAKQRVYDSAPANETMDEALLRTTLAGSAARTAREAGMSGDAAVEAGLAAVKVAQNFGYLNDISSAASDFDKIAAIVSDPEAAAAINTAAMAAGHALDRGFSSSEAAFAGVEAAKAVFDGLSYSAAIKVGLQASLAAWQVASLGGGEAASQVAAESAAKAASAGMNSWAVAVAGAKAAAAKISGESSEVAVEIGYQAGSASYEGIDDQTVERMAHAAYEAAKNARQGGASDEQIKLAALAAGGAIWDGEDLRVASIQGKLNSGVATYEDLLNIITAEIGSAEVSVMGDACFIGGTIIHTKDGLKAIEDITPGDWVSARHQANIEGPVHWRRVLTIYQHNDKQTVQLLVQYPDGEQEILTPTSNHPFYVNGQEWRAAAEIAPGDRLHLLNGEHAIFVSRTANRGLSTVFNFAVEEDHTYFVGNRGVWAHNRSGADYTKIAQAAEAELIRRLAKQGEMEIIAAAATEAAGASLALRIFGSLVRKVPQILVGTELLFHMEDGKRAIKELDGFRLSYDEASMQVTVTRMLVDGSDAPGKLAFSVPNFDRYSSREMLEFFTYSARGGSQSIYDFMSAGGLVNNPGPIGSGGAPNGTGGAIDAGIRWGGGIQGQGMPWENYIASQLPPTSRLPVNFKTYDFYDDITGIATSAKTLDTLTPAKLSQPQQAFYSLKANIDSIDHFENYYSQGVTVKAAEISTKKLWVAIPQGTTLEQWTQIQRAVAYGQSKNVQVVITTVR